MAEAHELHAVLAILDLADERVHAAALRMDPLQHLHDGLVGTAMQGPEEGVDAGGDAREQVRVRGPDESDGRGRAVLLMVGVQEEQLVQRLGEHRVYLVRLRGDAEGHAQEVVDEAEGVVGVQERLADRLLVGVGGDGGHLRHEPDGRDLDLLGIEGVQGVLVEGRQRRHRRREHRHRVGIAREAVEELAELLMEHRVPPDLQLEVVELLGGGQGAVDQQIRGLEEGRLLGELLDRVSAVAQDARIAIDVGDRRRACRRVQEPVVERDVTGLLHQRSDVQAGLADRRRHLGQGQLATGMAQGVFGHVVPPSR